MSINLTTAQAAITAAFHTNSATVLRATNTSVNGVIAQSFDVVLNTTCNIAPNKTIQPTPQNQEDIGSKLLLIISFPYGTDIRSDDRVLALGARYRVINRIPTPQFALETQVTAIDFSGEA